VIGIDLAKRSYQAKMVELQTGKEKTWDGTTDSRGIETLIRRLQAGDRIGIECCSHAMTLVRIITARVEVEMILLNAGQLHVIWNSIKKTDLVDAAKIALLLQRFHVSELPVVRMPSPEEEEQRSMMSAQLRRRKLRNMELNRLHSLFVREAITDITRGNLRNKDNWAESVKRLHGYSAKEAKLICATLDILEDNLAEIQADLKQTLDDNEQASRRLSIPGVGPVAASTFMGYVGDGSRFASGKQVSNYAGMTPQVDASGESIKLGGISKRGCVALRAILVQAAWAAVKSGGKERNPLKEKYAELSARRGKGRAIVAIARRILELMWAVSTRKERYRSTSALAWRLKLRRLGIESELAKSAA